MKSDATNTLALSLEVLELGWNSADGSRFAQPFADDADFVDIRGDHHRGQAMIANGHDAIFASIYKASRITYAVVDARHLSDDVILGHARSTLVAPSGPLAGTHVALASVVLLRSGPQWKIAAFHNSLVMQPSASPRGADA